MPNITISLDEKLLKTGREYAKRHHTSMNALIRKMLEQTVGAHLSYGIEECFQLMDRTGVNSRGKHWNRSDLYDV